MPFPMPGSFVSNFPGALLLVFGAIAVVFFGIVVFAVSLLTSVGRRARKAKALVATGHTVTATVTGVHEEHSRLQTGKSPVLGTPMYLTVTKYVFSAVWRDPRTGRDITFVKRWKDRDHYAIGSPVTVYIDPHDYSHYAIVN
jgi:hypothetical protein